MNKICIESKWTHLQAISSEKEYFSLEYHKNQSKRKINYVQASNLTLSYPLSYYFIEFIFIIMYYFAWNCAWG